MTSNDASINYFGYDKWKKIHRAAYIAETFIFVHLSLQGGNTLIIALAIFTPLIVLQRLRFSPR